MNHRTVTDEAILDSAFQRKPRRPIPNPALAQYLAEMDEARASLRERTASFAAANVSLAEEVARPLPRARSCPKLSRLPPTDGELARIAAQRTVRDMFRRDEHGRFVVRS